jgi:hypothetical protein
MPKGMIPDALNKKGYNAEDLNIAAEKNPALDNEKGRVNDTGEPAVSVEAYSDPDKKKFA